MTAQDSVYRESGGVTDGPPPHFSAYDNIPEAPTRNKSELRHWRGLRTLESIIHHRCCHTSQPLLSPNVPDSKSWRQKRNLKRTTSGRGFFADSSRLDFIHQYRVSPGWRIKLFFLWRLCFIVFSRPSDMTRY